MRIAVTGATGFLGRYIVRQLVRSGHSCRCWFRSGSDRSAMGVDDARIEWLSGRLNDVEAGVALVGGCDAVVHSALWRPGAGFRGAEGDVVEFIDRNVLGTMRLIEAARAAQVPRFVFISSCSVHERILDDRALDEAHPLWSMSHYGAHKAAIEKFIHSYGLGQGYAVCSLRPTGIYGAAHPIADSKWYELVQAVSRGKKVEVQKGGKEVHAADVAKSIEILLNAPVEKITGEAFNCYDTYIHEFEVATLAKELAGSSSEIVGQSKQPKHQIETGKLRALGMEFSGRAILKTTVQELLAPS